MMAGGKKKPPLMNIPSSIKMVDLAAKHGFTPKSDSEKRTVRERLKLEVSNSLNVPAPNSGSGLKHDTEVDDSWASLPVTAVHFYERNPRKANNDAYAELKESIRANGILQPLTVTKRPGETHYILYAGGNTRLQAVRELWEETADPKFRETRVIIKAWRGEASVLLAHMAENTQRNDMTFWDRANGTLEIKRQIEDERGAALTFREFEAEIKKFGLQTDLRTLSMYRFAVEKIADVGPWLSGLSVRTIQPRLNLLLKLANHHDIEESAFYAEVVTPTAKAIAGMVLEDAHAFSADLFLGRCEASMSVRLEVSERDIGKMLTAMERFPDMTLEGLQRICKPQRPVEPSVGGTQTQSTAESGGQEQGESSDPIPLDSRLSGTATPSIPAATEPGERSQKVSSPAPHSTVSLPPISTESGGPDRLMTLIQQVLVSAGLGSCYEPAPGMPMGYCMGFPKDGPLDLKENAQSRQAAWWVLAMASGQFEADVCRSGLDDPNEWRTLILEEGSQETLGGLELAIQHNIGGQGEFLPIPWLLNPDNSIAGVCLELLSVIRGGARS
ncbi:ParB family protein [Thiobacillus sp.]|uniref:ParB family protein n=1 Tax=Thiobacillus sp. TaxID=924 RepID=UPI001AD1FA41|nr:ParB family protein [Thiobacillus sp.]MBN8780968.1 ParB N-terminal domain-containing protein [Thiobacillus sp.]